MTEITLNGVSVKFPFKPYKVQEEYMTKVLECLQNSQHGVLESPTGTGKTLSLLCSSLSWLTIRKAQMQASIALKGIEVNPTGILKDLKNKLDFGGGTMETNPSWNAPRIIYASRTHSQLSQAMQELKRTSYKHVRATVIGSRDQMCIHPEVSKEQNSSTKIHMCQAKIKNRDCYYYNNVETRRNESVFTDEILDIEDLVKEGRKRKCCPYFLTRELKQTADIVFMPYNYLLDPKSRKSQGIDLKDNVILLDEAHNVEKTCEEAASLEITSTDIAMCISEITHAMTDIDKEMSDDKSDFTTEGANAVQKDFTPEDLMILKTMFLKLEEAVDAIVIKNKTEGETKPGGYIFELLESAQLNHEKVQTVSDKLDKIILYLTTTSLSVFSRKGNALQKFNDLLRIAFVGGRQMLNKHKDCYKVHIQYEEQKKSYNKHDSWDKKATKTSEGKVINYWCFSPGFGMQQLVNQGVRSVILTSGTLSPLKPFISEIGIHIAVTLENPHIVQSNQICVGVLSKGPDGHVLNSSYNTRNDPAYINSLGRAILNFSNLIPHGMLVFFPSYPIMNKCRDDWQQSSLWSKIAAKKPIFVEPQSKHNLPSIMSEFYEKVKSPEFKGAIFMAVCRGKVSEGLDFANNNGRAVLITGLPFPPLKDPRVILKKRYLDDNYAKDKNGITGQYWYQLEAMRAVNQAIGRIIRHKDDFGAIILCDCRFENSSNRNQLSSWIRPHVKHFTDFGMVTKELRNFFTFLKKLYPEFETNRVEKLSNSKTMDVSSSTKKRPCSDEPLKSIEPVPEDTLKMYLNNTKPQVGKQENSSNLIDALKTVKSKPLFNFNSCSSNENKSRKPEQSIEEITQTRKKIKLMKVPFVVENPVPSTSKDENQPKRESSQTSEEKKPFLKNYITQVKQFLKSNDKFQEFREMVVDYAKNKNYENVLQQLHKLFLSETTNLELYIGFQSYIKAEHKQRFKEQIEILSVKKAEEETHLN